MTMCTATPALASVSSAVDRELATAAQLQRMLLPPSPFTANGWTAEHHFVPAGDISGDFVDLVPFRDRVYFMLGRCVRQRRSRVARDGTAACHVSDADSV
jgi:serine phosphatase RsbU (regulator of sigma subunit)